MVTMYLNGITITVHAADVNFYKQAGYSVVRVGKTVEPVENNEETGDAEPAKKPAKK